MPAVQEMERLMDAYGDAVFRMCLLYLKDYHLAEDAAQETFIKAMNSYDSLRGKAAEKTWLTKIAINCCKNIMRSSWFRLSRNELKEETTAQGRNILEQLDEYDSMAGAIMKLNSGDRQMILLYYYQELSMKEIAKIIGKSENTVSQRMNRARRRLKKILMEAGYENG